MKKQFIIPMVVAASMAMFTACSDDSSSSPASPSIPEIDQPVVPGENGDVVTPEQPDIPGGEVVDPNVPVDPNAPVVNPNQPAVPGGDVTPETPVENPDVPVVNPGQPVVTDPNATYTYYGAELSGVDQFKYGRFEARMKMVSIPGSVSSMFLYYDDSWKLDDEPWNEIDIEVLGKGGTFWQANLITREPNVTNDDGTVKKNAKITSESKPEFGFDATEDFHLYAMIWTPEYISWEIDSVEIRRDVIGNPDGRKHDQVAFMTEQQSLRFNLWASKSVSWVGKFTGEELAAGPQTQYIDYVRVYSYDTASKTFKQEWQDDFEGTELSDHWATGNWEMEKVMLSPDNVVVEDGYCKMLMTRVAD